MRLISPLLPTTLLVFEEVDVGGGGGVSPNASLVGHTVAWPGHETTLIWHKTVIIHEQQRKSPKNVPSCQLLKAEN